MPASNGKQTKGRIIFIPAYGTNSGIFQNLTLPEDLLKQSLFIEWPDIKDENSMSEYAHSIQKLFQINEKDILVGVSMGGMIAMEINRIKKVDLILSISSIKGKSEMPFLFRFLKFGKIYTLVSPKIMKRSISLIKMFYGFNPKKYNWFFETFKKSSDKFMKIALKWITLWEPPDVPDNLIHIHGSLDPLFPIWRIKQPYIRVDKGTHAMIRLKGEEISNHLVLLIRNKLDYADF